MFHADTLFSPETELRKAARELYESVAALPIVSPHGHVDPRLFSDPDATFGTPADLFILPDHYVTRMLYSQGIPLESLGVQRKDGGPVETDHRKIWRIFCENFRLFRGTPSGLWLRHELGSIFEISVDPTGENADRLYDGIAEKFSSPEYRPRRLYERFNIEVLSTTDPATSTLEQHRMIRDSRWRGRVIPCFRPDGVINLRAPGWRENIAALGSIAGKEISDYPAFISALEVQRNYFKSMGAVATDQAVLTPYTCDLPKAEADAIFRRALRGEATLRDDFCFTGHMLMEMARMSIEDGLVMQLHAGAFRDHNSLIFERFGPDLGADIPIRGEFTRNLRPLLNRYGNDPRLTLVLCSLDESTYSREVGPLAGHYPALKIGPPWWFFDSPNGIQRYFDQIMETAGLYNTAGFTDDAHAFCSIPSRHDVWRRVSANWVAGLAVRHIVSKDDAREMVIDLAYNLVKQTYRL